MIYVYKEENAAGNYQDDTGKRYLVHTARRLHGAVRPVWVEYESLETALADMQLIPLPVPEDAALSEDNQAEN